MRLTALAVVASVVLPVPLMAQNVQAPPSTNAAGATVLHSAGNAAGVVQKGHEVPAQIVGGTTPALKPFTSGVTGAGRSVSYGLRDSGDNVAKSGLKVQPTGSIGKTQQGYQTRAVQDTIDQAKKVPPTSDELKCDAQELAMGECQ